MQAKIAVALTHLLVGYLKKHPQVIESVVNELAKIIPGKADDVALAFLEKLLKAL